MRTLTSTMAVPGRPPPGRSISPPAALALLLASLACGDPTGPSVTLTRLAGVWNETSCVITSVAVPIRQETCVIPLARLTLDESGDFLYSFPTLPGSDPPIPGHLEGTHPHWTATFAGDTSFPVTINDKATSMVWEISTEGILQGQDTLEPVTLTKSWAKAPLFP